MNRRMHNHTHVFAHKQTLEYSAIEKNELLAHATVGMNLSINVSEKQTLKSTYCVGPFTKRQTWEQKSEQYFEVIEKRNEETFWDDEKIICHDWDTG